MSNLAKRYSIHPHLQEFKEKAPTDGFILFLKSEECKIIKVKQQDRLSVDLIYDGNSIFLDAERNMYTYMREDEDRKTVVK